MPARTGTRFFDGLHDDRAIWLDGERIKDVRTHPALRRGVAMLLVGLACRLAESLGRSSDLHSRASTPLPRSTCSSSTWLGMWWVTVLGRVNSSTNAFSPVIRYAIWRAGISATTRRPVKHSCSVCSTRPKPFYS